MLYCVSLALSVSRLVFFSVASYWFAVAEFAFSEFFFSSLIADGANQRATTLPIPRVVTRDLPIFPRFTPTSFYRDAGSGPLHLSLWSNAVFLVYTLRGFAAYLMSVADIQDARYLSDHSHSRV